jgi:hypothetical protein
MCGPRPQCRCLNQQLGSKTVNPFKFEFQTRSNLDWSKNDVPELQKFEIKYDFEYLKKVNNVLHRNFF